MRWSDAESPTTDDRIATLDDLLREHALRAEEAHDPGETVDLSSRLDARTRERVATLGSLTRSTVPQLRRMLVTPTHTQARLTAFFSTWAYERHWIADRLTAIAGGPTRPTDPTSAARRDRAQRIELLATAVWTNLVGDAVVAVHVLECLMDDWLTELAHEAVAEDCPDVVLAEELEGIRGIRATHVAILERACAVHLPPGQAGRWYVARALRRFGWPGRGLLDQREVEVLRALVRRAPDRLAEVAERIGSLGLGEVGLTLASPGASQVIKVRRAV